MVSLALDGELLVSFQYGQEIDAPDAASIEFMLRSCAEVRAIIADWHDVPQNVLKLARVAKEVLEQIPRLLPHHQLPELA
jgi:hypothetical protein